jgi:putative transposase
MGYASAARSNAATESYFSLMQESLPDGRICNMREDLCIAIVTWIKQTQHRRPQTVRGCLTPVEFKLILPTLVDQAA